MPLQTGAWTINANGTVGQMRLDSVDPQGNVRGVYAGGFPFLGFWDEASQRLTFAVTLSAPAPGGLVQLYTGFLFEDQVRITGVTGGLVLTLAGYFEDFRPPATAKRSSFGWYAQIGVE